MRVLGGDDEQLARDRLKRLVDKIANAEVVAEAANGREAIIEAQSCKPDVVLMDIDQGALDKALTKISGDMDRQIKRTLIADEDKAAALAQISTVTDVAGLSLIHLITRRRYAVC